MSVLDSSLSEPLILAGSMGTSIIAKNLEKEVFGSHPGCFEYLVEAAPEVIRSLYGDFLAAGCDIIETDTFCAIPGSLSAHGLADHCAQLNERAALIARAAVSSFGAAGRPRFVAGSVGPGWKLPSWGQIDYGQLYNEYLEQMAGLLAGGVDLILIETCQDLLQIKAAVAAARSAMSHDREVPIYVSITLDKNGHLLTGPGVAETATALASLPIDFLGLNCGYGPSAMAPYMTELAKWWPRRLGFYPNAGLPVSTARGLQYPETPATMTATIDGVIKEVNLSIIGGCCGTTPAHIAELYKAIHEGLTLVEN